jgi:hypothetical protein
MRIQVDVSFGTGPVESASIRKNTFGSMADHCSHGIGRLAGANFVALGRVGGEFLDHPRHAQVVVDGANHRAHGWRGCRAGERGRDGERCQRGCRRMQGETNDESGVQEGSVTGRPASRMARRDR